MKVNLAEPLFQKAIPILQTLEDHGYEAYFVGGSVRDKILDRPIHDIDIASSAKPEEVQAIFQTTIDVGKDHGTIIAVVDQEAYEITTFRTEGTYSDFRRPDEVHFVRNLQEDTLRRDFTINAIAIDRTGKVYDYHGGMEDIQRHLIKAVGVAKERFGEDALRMMRAIRFASQLGFDIEEETLQAIRELAPLLKNISIERVRIEFSKYMQGPHLSKVANLLEDTGLIHYLVGFQDLEPNIMETVSSKLLAMNEQNKEVSESLAWAILVETMGLANYSQIKRFLKAWTHSNRLIQDVSDMVRIMDIYEKNALDLWTVYHYSDEVLDLVDEWYCSNHPEFEGRLAALRDELVVKDRYDLVVNGRDIMVMLDLDKGTPQVGDLFNQIEYKVVTNALANDYQVIEAYVKSKKDA